LDTLTGEREREDRAMSDEHEHRRDPGRGASEPDDTRQFSPFEDDETQLGEPIHPDGDTRSDDADATEAAPPVDADATRAAPPVDADATRAGPPDDADATQVVPPVAATPPPPRDATAVMPVPDWDAAPDSVWAGRAEVRPPRPVRLDDTAADWSAVPPAEPRGKWWMPIVVGIVGLILVGLLAWGIYLIAQNAGDDTPTPPATASAPPVTTAPTTTEPTTTPPTTTPATTEPTGPTEVTVPALVGLSRAEAQQALQRRGLSFREIFRPDEAAPGTVIDSDPAEGQEVPPDTRVTLVIATEPAPPTTTATATTTPTGEADED
jgi:hypothetical protein